MTTTKLKPVASGSYTNATLDSHGRVLTSDPTISALTSTGAQLQVMQATNEWHNAPANTSSNARAQATANASGILIEDV